jgi:acyl carrier protein
VTSEIGAPEVARTVRAVIEAHGRLPGRTSVGDDEDLFRAGMTSHATVNVMLALEEAFDIEFSDELLTKSTFRSVSSIQDAVLGLMG